MRLFFRAVMLGLSAAIAAGCQSSAGIGPSVPPAATGAVAPNASAAHRDLAFAIGQDEGNQNVQVEESLGDVCEKVYDPMRATCFGQIRSDAVRTTAFPTSTTGLTPKDLSSLYMYPSPYAGGRGGSGQIVGIVVAYSYASAESDLSVYRSYYGLPACTTANGCFKKLSVAASPSVSASSAPYSVSAHPTTNASGWAAEVDADTQAVSAVCPNCKILVAEAASDSLADLGKAVRAADAAGATIINASFGAPEASGQLALESTFVDSDHGVKLVAAAGDSGPGVFFPAASSKAIAVAGTSLSVLGLAVDEGLWSGSGYGCSAYFAKPAWQTGSCPRRSVADVAAIADPKTGLLFYDSTLAVTSGGWSVVGGTSISAPIVAALYALSGDARNDEGAQHFYQSRDSFLPVLPISLRNADVATGLGVPQGLGGF